MLLDPLVIIRAGAAYLSPAASGRVREYAGVFADVTTMVRGARGGRCEVEM